MFTTPSTTSSGDASSRLGEPHDRRADGRLAGRVLRCERKFSVRAPRLGSAAWLGLLAFVGIAWLATLGAGA